MWCLLQLSGILVWLCGANMSQLDPNGMLQLYQENQWTDVIVVFHESARTKAQTLVNTLCRGFISSQGLSVAQLKETNVSMDARYLFILDDWSQMRVYATSIYWTRIQTSLVYLTVPNADPTEMNRYMELRNFYFYVLQDSWPLAMFSVMCTPRFSGPIWNPIGFQDPHLQLKESYNLQGETIHDLSVTYFPFSFKTAQGRPSGLYPDLFQALSERFNFTTVHEFEPFNNWGVLPESGTFESGTFGGAMGGIISGDYDVSLNGWFSVSERFDLLDSEPLYYLYFVLAMVPKPLKIDIRFFQHPFSCEAWTSILITAFIICVCVIPPSLLLGRFEYMDSYVVASTSAWVFFLLIDSFYCGALTMFFSTKAAPPFKHFSEVVQAYPTWVLKVIEGNEVLFYDRAAKGDVDYQNFYDRMRQKPEETTYSEIQPVLEQMKDEYIVILANIGMLRSAFKHNIHLSVPLEYLSKLDELWSNIILTKNSPLRPMIRKAFALVRDKGLLSNLIQKWEGHSSPKSKDINAYPMGLGHTLLVYIVITLAVITSFIALALEFGYLKIQTFLGERKPTNFNMYSYWK